jgi:predicted secreted protein
MKYAFAALLALSLPGITCLAAEAKPAGTLIDFHAHAQRTAPNDLGRASAYFEASSAQPAELAKRVNATLATALATAKGHAEVKVRTGATQTYPVYAKNSRTIESWRMRSELLMESRDAAALSELLGKLQATLAVGNISFAPAPETRRTIEDDTAIDAIANFTNKAGRYAGALKKRYRIVSMNIGGQDAAPPAPTFRAMAMAAESAPMPVEAGESQITVTVSGQIELTD